jgi:hypothetical protein
MASDPTQRPSPFEIPKTTHCFPLWLDGPLKGQRHAVPLPVPIAYRAVVSSDYDFTYMPVPASMDFSTSTVIYNFHRFAIAGWTLLVASIQYPFPDLRHDLLGAVFLEMLLSDEAKMAIID